MAETPAFDHERVLLVGDVHGNTSFIELAITEAVKQRADVIIQLGDFGFWEHTERGRDFLDTVESVLASHETATGARLELWFLDGNHENHDLLAELPRDEHGRGVAREHVLHLPRGWRGRLAGQEWGFLGGAFSIDHRHRVLGVSVWAAEQLTTDDVAALGSSPLQVLCAHDVFDGVPLDDVCPFRFELAQTDEDASMRTRELLRRAVDATKPKAFFHGHWHNRYSHHYEDTSVKGLGAESIQLATLLVGADGTEL